MPPLQNWQKKKKTEGERRSFSSGSKKLRSATDWSGPGSSSHRASADPVTEPGTAATNTMATRGPHHPGSTARSGRAPPGTPGSPPTFRGGPRQSLLVRARLAKKIFAKSSAIRVQFLGTSAAGCRGSVTEAAATVSTVETTFPRAHRGAVISTFSGHLPRLQRRPISWPRLTSFCQRPAISRETGL